MKYKLTKNKSITISSLSSGTNYQFKVRAYKLVDDETKYYGNWSAIKVIKTTGKKADSSSDSSTDKTNTVYTTETGSKYHSTKSCSGLSNAKAIYTSTLSKAKDIGLTACSKCY